MLDEATIRRHETHWSPQEERLPCEGAHLEEASADELRAALEAAEEREDSSALTLALNLARREEVSVRGGRISAGRVYLRGPATCGCHLEVSSGPANAGWKVERLPMGIGEPVAHECMRHGAVAR